MNSHNQMFYTCVAIGSAFLLWSFSAGLSNYLAEEPAREFAKEHGDHTSPVRNKQQIDVDHAALSKDRMSSANAKIEDLKKSWQEKQTDESRMLLAQALFEFGVGLPHGAYLKEAVGHFHEILEKYPENPEALFGMASLSLHVGVADRAAEYYQRLLKVRPGDQSSRANYALALSRSGKLDEGMKEIDQVLSENPSNPLSIVTKGLLLIEKGEVENGVSQFRKALEFEQSPFLRKRIESLIANAQGAPSAEEGPQEYITAQVVKHSVLSNKVRKIEVENGVATLLVLDFPVASMPPMAKAKLEERFTSWIQASGLSRIQIVDFQSKRQLFETLAK